MQTALSSRQSSTGSLRATKRGQAGASTDSWSTTGFDPGQNAISILLERPFASTSSLYDPLSARDIPPVALTNIQHVEDAEFKSYISQVGALYEQLQRIKDIEDEAQSKQESNHGPPPLSVIPSVYFEDDFHLENPRTFRVVSDRSEVVAPNPMIGKASIGIVAEQRKSLSTNAILQEKLSWYMDIVEVHLIDTISAASTTFLSVLDSFKELYAESAELVQGIKAQRMDLALLDENIVIGSLRLLEKQHRCNNLQQMQDVLQQLQRVVDGIAYCESLVDRGEVEKAHAEIDAIELLMAGERDETSGDKPLTKSQLRDLRRATIIQGVASDLTALRCRIGKVCEARLYNVLIKDLRRHVESISTHEILLRWEASSLRSRGGDARNLVAFPAYMGMADELRASLDPIISGLYQSGSVSKAILAYRDSVLEEIQNIVRRPLPSTEDIESVTSASASVARGGRSRTNQEKSSILARNIRSLDGEDAEKLFSAIFTGVTETLRRVKTQSSILLDVACSIGNADTRISHGLYDPQEEIYNAFDIPNLLGEAVDVSHEKIVRLLRVRTEQTKNLPLASFLRYFKLNLLFANECEAVSGRPGTLLKNTVNGHILDYIKAHGERENKAFSEGMSSDKWKDKDFSPRDDKILKLVLQCGTSNPPEWTELNKIWPLLQPEADFNLTEDNNEAREKVRAAFIDGEMFLLPSSAILCLEGISRFLRLMGGIPSMTSDIAMSLIAYLRVFDARCRQLVLGTGAMLSAGLKNISTTNLVVALQAVTFIATIVPHIREFVRRYTSPGCQDATVLAAEFDKVQHALQEHQEAIYEKLVHIMASRARIHAKKAREIDWDTEEAAQEQDHENGYVRGYITDLVRDTSMLYKALAKRRPPRVVAQVMARVFRCYEEHLRTAFEEIDLKTEIACACVLCDIEYLIDKLGSVEGFDNLGTVLVEVVKTREKETKIGDKAS